MLAAYTTLKAMERNLPSLFFDLYVILIRCICIYLSFIYYLFLFVYIIYQKLYFNIKFMYDTDMF